MEHKKATQRLNNEKLKILKHLPVCTVVLHDIILNPESIPQIYHKHLLRKPLKLLKPSSSLCVTPKRFSNNMHLLKEKAEKQNTIEKENYILTRSHSKKVTQRNTGGRNQNNETQLNNESSETRDSDQYELIQPKLRGRKQRITSNSSNELFAIKSDKSSDVSTYCSHECCSIKTLTKKKKGRLTCRKILYCDESDVAKGTSMESVKVGPDDTNCLDKKNLTFVNYNRRMEGISTESITHMECNNNLHPFDVTNETNNVVRKKQFNKKQNSKDVSLSVINTDLNDKIYKYMNTLTKENINRDAESKNLHLSNNLSPTCNDMDKQQNQQEARTNSKNKTTIVNCSAVPKITGNNILPTGTIKIINKHKTNTNSQNSTFINISKLSDSLLTLNNNMNEKGKNNDLRNKIINNHNLNSLKKSKNSTCNDIDMFDADNEKTIIYENFVSSQEQSNRLHNDEMHASKSQGSCSTEINYNEDILNKTTSNTSGVMNETENYINESFNLIKKDGAVNKNRKRTAEEDEEFNYNRKKKLNRNSWIEYNGVLTKPINQQRNNLNNDVINNNMTITAQPNIVSKDEELGKQDNDLRNHLNSKRLKRTDIQELTFERECNNKDSAVSFEQINVENKNDTIIATKEQTKEYYKKLSVEKEPTINETCREEENNTQVNSHHDLLNMIQDTEKITKENSNTEKQNTSGIDNEEDGDCIFLFTDESFDESLHEDTIPHKKNEPHKECVVIKPLDSNEPYKMSENSFDKYVKQNKCEFNQEYAKCRNDIDNNAEMSKSNEIKEQSNNQREQTLCTNYIPTIAPTKVTPPIIGNIDQAQDKITQVIFGYCFPTLRNGTCCWPVCKFKHNYQYLIKEICSKEPRTIFELLQSVSATNFNFFCEQMYIASLTKLSVEQILMIYAMLYDSRKENFTLSRTCVDHIIIELLNREISLKTIVKRLVEYMPVKSAEKINNILRCVDEHVKLGEYWNTVRILILQPSFQPVKHIIEKILKECVYHENLPNIQDVNNTLINTLHPTLMSTLDKHLVECFMKLLKKTMKNSPAALIQSFGENAAAEDIASPDSNADENLQVETPKQYDIITAISNDASTSYTIQPIDDLPDPRSIFRDHERLWKFYIDLERLKKGLAHKDYDYVIDILKSYKEKEDENHFFIQSCCNLFRTEIKHSEYHVTNIIRRTVQTGTCGILSETLFNIGLNILVSLMNKEAWGLALSLIPSLNIYDLLHNAEFFLLVAEVYLANEKTIKAFDLLKYKNIICTSRAKWHVKSTINDEHVRNRIMYILLDSFCNEYFEYAFFLFQFLLKDQSSQYYPIDLSRYVTKLIILSLSKMNTTLITEMSNLILKYNFALSIITCRALISTLVHINEALAKQIYNYAEGIGIYSAVKLWPVIYVTISTDLTEEEMYLIFLQLLKKLLMNLGPTVEFVKPYQIKVYLILEIKSMNEQFYCADSQNYYNKKVLTNTKTLVSKVLKKRFDPPMSLMRNGSQGRIHRLQSTSLINYLKSEHCYN